MHLHLIAPILPYPPLTGMEIDTYYLLRGLADEGVRVTLHAFTHGELPGPDIYRYVEEVYTYPTRSLARSLPLRYPHIVRARDDHRLLDQLLLDELPILFAGMASTYFLSHPDFDRRVKLVRLHEIAWQRYAQYANREKGYLQRQYYQAESRQLKTFEKTLEYADHLLSISPTDSAYYQDLHEHVQYVPPFHAHSKVSSRPGRGTYCLYHANLGQPDNHAAAMFLIEEIFHQLDLPLIIAGAEPQPDLISAISAHDHIVLRPTPGTGELADLLHDAQVHVLPSFHRSGLSLKLVNSLYTGRFVVVNPRMVERTGLEFGTHMTRTPEEMQRIIFDLWHQDFSEIDIAQRKAALNGLFSNQRNAQKIVELIRNERM